MLNASKFIGFMDAAIADIPELKQKFWVIRDEDVAKETREVSSSNDHIVLIGGLPSYGLDFKNRDNYSHKNPMHLFIVKKYDTKSGSDELQKLFDDTAAAVLKFEAWMFAESEKFQCSPLFKDIDFETFNADPVSNYYGFCGYMINFDLKN